MKDDGSDLEVGKDGFLHPSVHFQQLTKTVVITNPDEIRSIVEGVPKIVFHFDPEPEQVWDGIPCGDPEYGL